MDINTPRGAGSAFGGKNFDYKKIMQWLGYALRCPVCGCKYNLDQTKIIESETEEMSDTAKILIHSECVKCKGSVIFNIEINGPEVLTAAMITDLTHQDSAKFKNRTIITADEIIGIHQQLKKFNGSLVEALTKK